MRRRRLCPPAARLAAAVLAVSLLGLSVRTRAAESPSDSLNLRRAVVVRGGRALSTREVRQAFLTPGPTLSRSQVEEALRRLGRSLIEQGYLEATLRLRLDETEAPVLEVKEGPRTRWGAVRVRATAQAESLLAEDAGEFLRPREGSETLALPSGRFLADRWEELLGRWIGLWCDRGYPFAWASVESLSVEDGCVQAGLHFDPGPLCRVAEVNFPGLTTTRASFLRRWIRFRPGQIYRESEWGDRRRRCEQLGLFLRVGEPVPGCDRSGIGRVDLPVVEGKHNRLEAAAGYAGTSGTLSYLADLELGDLFGTGRFFRARYDRLRPKDGRLLLQYREPMILSLPLGLRLSLEQTERDSTYSLSVWEGLLEASAGWDLTAFAGGEYRRSLTGAEPAELGRRLSSVVGGRWDTRSPVRWRGGLFEASYRSGRSDIRTVDGKTYRSRVDKEAGTAERYTPLPGGLLLRTLLKAEAIAGNDSLPLSEAMRIGGAGSLRGYAEEQFATRRYGVGQVELGLGWPGGRIYAFADAGWFRPIDQRAGTASASGIGLGFATENARQRLSLDLGVPRGGTLGEARLHLRMETRF